MSILREEQGHFTIRAVKVPFTLRRSSRRRRSIGVSVHDEEVIRINAPLRAPFAAIEQLVRRNELWIMRQLDHLRCNRQSKEQKTYADGDTLLYRGAPVPLRVISDQSQPQGCRVDNDRLEINLHAPSPIAGERREEVRLEISIWLKREAKRLLAECVEEWAQKLGVRHRRFIVSDPLRHWGSCTAQNDIRLNWRLIMAAPELLDYVAVHELCHIPHKNHSRRFWATVERAIPDAKARRKKLRALGPLLAV